ncbi:hypothetical protein OTU49_008136 [Cherax quadricarinatus]|uniref:Fibronectin type-III domain-containing protein n=2 Tax=Cherax quadricarinatus TaxID=27406 RepID=A0AAW0WT85_CHEQU
MVVNPGYVSDSAEAMINAAGSNVVWPILFPVSAPLTNTPFKSLAEETGGRVLEVFDQRFNVSQQSLSVQHTLVQHLRTIQDNILRYTSYIPKLQVTQQQLLSNPATIEFLLANDTEASSLFLYSHCQSSYIEINNKPVPGAINITTTSSMMLLSNLQRGRNTIEVGFEECSEPQLAEVLVQQEEKHLQVEFWASHDLSFLDLTNPQDPVVLFVKVTQDSRLIVGAQVVVVFLVGNDKYELPLYDNGGGSPDVTGGDGVYSRYLVYVPSGRSAYTLQVNVSSTSSSKIVGTTSNTKPDLTCCGSSLPIHLLPAQDFTANYVSVMGSAVVVKVPGLLDIFPPARVTDLRAHTSEDQVILTFTAPGDDLDRGYAMEYRVFWSDDGDKWMLVDTAIYVVVEGGSVAQVMVSPLLCDQLVHYRVRARDTRMQEGQDSNVASVQSSCSSLTTFVPTDSPTDDCPSHAGAICGAFFGGLVTGVLIAALAYFLYFRFCKTSDKALPTSSHLKQSNVQNSTTNRLNTSYTNPAFSNDSGNSHRSTPDQNRALSSHPPPRESIQTSYRDRGSRNLAKPEAQITQTRSPSGTTQTKPLSIQINQTSNPIVQANQTRPLSAQIPQHRPPVEITQPRPLAAQIPQHGPPVEITQPRPPSSQILQHSPPVEITQPRPPSAQIPQHRPPAEITQPRPLPAQVTHTRRPSANVTLNKSNSVEVSQTRKLSSNPSVPPQLPRQYSVHATPPAVPPQAGYISDEDDANDDTASQTSELIYDTAYS